MDFLALLRKEAITVRRNLGLFVVLLVLLPAMLAGVTGVYQHTIPEDIPVGVVAADEETTEDDLAIVRAGVTFFATSVDYDSPDAAREGLQREEVYLVVVVPPGLMTEGEPANITIVSDQTIVPFEEPANVTTSIVDSQLDRQLPSDVSVEHERLGEPRALSEYLIPVGLVAFVVIYGLVFVPYQVRNERLVLDRLQTTSSLETVLASKLVFYGAAVAVPAFVVGLTALYMGYEVAALTPFTFLTIFLTFLMLAATGLAILFALGLDRSALFVNVGLVFGIVALSGLLYPVGFFSTTEKVIARALPTHYAGVTTRSAMLRDTPMSLYTDYLLFLIGATVLALIALQLALIHYRRRR